MATDDPTPEQVAAAQKRSAEDSTEAGVSVGLEDARATLAEIWRRTLDDAARHRAMRALGAVISAEQTMRAADAFLRASGPKAQRETFEKLRVSACLRIGHETRKSP